MKPNLERLLKDAPKAPMPSNVQPMLAKLIQKPFDSKEWLYEIKWDGYRALTYIKNREVHLFSRNQKSFDLLFSVIRQELEKKMSFDAVLDGEVVVLDERGRSRFQLMQNYQQNHEGELVYYLFDILYLKGHDLTELPLLQRKEI